MNIARRFLDSIRWIGTTIHQQVVSTVTFVRDSFSTADEPAPTPTVPLHPIVNEQVHRLVDEPTPEAPETPEAPLFPPNSVYTIRTRYSALDGAVTGHAIDNNRKEPVDPSTFLNG